MSNNTPVFHSAKLRPPMEALALLLAMTGATQSKAFATGSIYLTNASSRSVNVAPGAALNSTPTRMLLKPTAVPTLSSTLPTSGAAGSTITLTGTDLTGTTLITFAGTSGNTVTTGFTVNAAGTQLSGLVVPAGALTGPLTITTSGGMSNSVSFTVVTSYQTLALSGFNADVVANGTGTASSSTTQSFDQNTYVLQELGYRGATVGLPASGLLSSATTLGLPFQLASYSGNNALRLSASSSGTLTLSTPQAAAQLYLLAASGDGAAAMNVTVTFSDGTTQVFTGLPVGDWFNGSPIVISGVGRTSRSASTVDNNTSNPRLYETLLTLSAANQAKQVSSLTVTNTASGSSTLELMGVTARPPLLVSSFGPSRNAMAAAPTTNVDLTFNQDLNSTTAANVRLFSSQHGGQLVRGGNATASSNVLSVNPAADLKPGETVFMTVPASVTSSTGTPNQPQVFQFTAAAGVGPGKFMGTTNVPVGTGTYAVALGDLDNDGDLDMVTANSTTNTASVRRNDGTGTYSGTTSVTVGNGPQDVALGDVDSDGDLDLVTANFNDATVSVSRNDGTGTFNTPTTVTMSTFLSAVALGDVDGDGDLDLVTVTGANSSANISLNNGSGTFGTITSVVLAANNGPVSVALGDVDSDGDLDLVTANYKDNTSSICFNNGTGTFSTPTTIVIGNGPQKVILGDVDGDGDLDLVTANYASAAVGINLNNGAGTFSALTKVSMGSNPVNVALGDVDGDGDLDLVTANNTANKAYIALNNGTGAFGSVRNVNVGSNAVGLALGDVDGDGDLDLATTNYYDNTVSVRLNQAAPVLSNITPNSGSVGTSLTLTGTYFTGATAVTFNGTVVTSFTLNSATSITVTVPTGATTGQVTVTTPSGTSNGVFFTVSGANLTVSTMQAIPAGTYTNVTVTSTGIGTLSGAVTVTGTMLVQDGGTLNTNCQALTGSGSFTLAAGGTLGICDAAGIASSGATGAVQTTGGRSFSPDASYLYNGTTAQSTGSGLPSQVRNLSTTNANAVTLTAPTSVTQVVTVGGAGNLVLNGNALTLLSSAAGTALVVNSGTGLVSGNTATVQRFIDASGNTGSSGYRHYSAPVSGATVGSLTTAGFTPVVNSAYNSAANSVTVTPYPTVYGYDQSRVGSATQGTNLSAFDQGYVSPSALTDPLAVGQGYTVQIGNSELVSLTGTLNNGNQTIAGSRSAQANAGWQLIGNPYPAPLDWGTVAGSQLTNMDAAAYVFQSTDAYSGRYTSFTNGIGASAGLIATGQGFFVRTNAATGSVALTNANRITTYGATPKFQRTAADARPQLRLSLTLGSAPATAATVQDETFVYFEQGATAGFDGQYDAYKLANPSGYYLGTAAQVPTGALEIGLSISGRAPLTTAGATDAVPVWLSVPAGTYALTTTELANFATLAGGTSVHLHDALTGTLTNLATTPSYSFSVAANAPSTGRFTLLFGINTPLATSSATLTQAITTLYPNPSATGEVTLSVAGLPTSVRSLQATLLDMLGRPVATYRLPTAQGTASTSLPTRTLTSGIYLLHLTPCDVQGSAVGTLPTQRLSVR